MILLLCRLIEDCVRDLLLNNDHIHVVEQQMREAIKTGLRKDTHKDASVKCFPTYVRYTTLMCIPLVLSYMIKCSLLS